MEKSQKQALRTLVGSMCENYAAEQLCNFPFIGLQEDVDEALEYKCDNIEDIKTSPPFHKMLYAWRIQRGNFRGGQTYDPLHVSLGILLMVLTLQLQRFSTITYRN